MQSRAKKCESRSIQKKNCDTGFNVQKQKYWITSRRTMGKIRATKMRLIRRMVISKTKDKIWNEMLKRQIRVKLILLKIKERQFEGLEHVLKMPESRVPTAQNCLRDRYCAEEKKEKTYNSNRRPVMPAQK